MYVFVRVYKCKYTHAYLMECLQVHVLMHVNTLMGRTYSDYAFVKHVFQKWILELIEREKHDRQFTSPPEKKKGKAAKGNF